MRVKSFTQQAADLFAYPALYDDKGQEIRLNMVNSLHGSFLCKIDGVHDRTQAESYKHQKLFVTKDALPPLEDEDDFYHQDLIGLKVKDGNADLLGTIIHVENFGADDLLEIRPESAKEGFYIPFSFYIPFTRQNIPLIDIANGHVCMDKIVFERFQNLAKGKAQAGGKTQAEGIS